MQRRFRRSTILIILLMSCTSIVLAQDIGMLKGKINGVSFVASKNHVTHDVVKPVIEIHANWVALMPFGFVSNLNDSNLRYNTKWQWWGEKIAGVREASKVFEMQKIKRMLKPQIWVHGGFFTGEIKMNSDAEWSLFEKKYEEFILEHAKLADEENFEMFCVGTELNSFVVERQEFWKELIHKIRKVYQGKLTYAANWDSYKNPGFWEQLDFIGIDAYFPLSTHKNPTVNDLNKSWIPIKNELQNFSKQKNIPIVFTEFGYRSIDYTTREPWDSNNNGNFNSVAQKNALESIFSTFWNEEWFQGGFLWKWFDAHKTSGGKDHKGYTVQNKLTEQWIAQQFKKINE